jgi:hypothetical protein
VEYAVAGHAFVSYSREDSGYVSRLVGYLMARGVPVWQDSGVDYGDRWADVVQTQVDTCAVFVLVMSPAAAASAWVERELARAEQQRRPIAPMLLAGQPLFRVGNIQYVDVTGGAMPPDRFVEALRRLTSTAAADLPATGPAAASGASAIPTHASAAGGSPPPPGVIWWPYQGGAQPVPGQAPPAARSNAWRWMPLVVVLVCGCLGICYGLTWISTQNNRQNNAGQNGESHQSVGGSATAAPYVERLANPVSVTGLFTGSDLTVTVTSVKTDNYYTLISIRTSNDASGIGYLGDTWTLFAPGSNSVENAEVNMYYLGAPPGPSIPVWVHDIPTGLSIEGEILFNEGLGETVHDVTLENTPLLGGSPELVIPLT